MNVRDLLVGTEAADSKQADAAEDVRKPRCRDVEHREEDSEVEESGTKVVRLNEDEHAGTPDHKQRPEIFQPSLGENFALPPKVGGEKDDQEDLRNLAWLKREAADRDPQARPVHGRADAGNARKEEQGDRSNTEEVLVRLKDPVVAS